MDDGNHLPLPFHALIDPLGCVLASTNRCSVTKEAVVPHQAAPYAIVPNILHHTMWFDEISFLQRWKMLSNSIYISFSKQTWKNWVIFLLKWNVTLSLTIFNFHMMKTQRSCSNTLLCKYTGLSTESLLLGWPTLIVCRLRSLGTREEPANKRWMKIIAYYFVAQCLYQPTHHLMRSSWRRRRLLHCSALVLICPYSYHFARVHMAIQITVHFRLSRDPIFKPFFPRKTGIQAVSP